MIGKDLLHKEGNAIKIKLLTLFFDIITYMKFLCLYLPVKIFRKIKQNVAKISRLSFSETYPYFGHTTRLMLSLIVGALFIQQAGKTPLRYAPPIL